MKSSESTECYSCSDHGTESLDHLVEAVQNAWLLFYFVCLFVYLCNFNFMAIHSPYHVLRIIDNRSTPYVRSTELSPVYALRILCRVSSHADVLPRNHSAGETLTTGVTRWECSPSV